MAQTTPDSSQAVGDLTGKTHNDSPTTICELDRALWRASVAQQIRQAKPPKVMAVHGTWGTGKTSLLAQLYTDFGGSHQFSPESGSKQKKKKAAEKPEIQAIWFEAWQYQHEEDILAALLKEIRDQLSLPYKIGNAAGEVAAVGLMSALQSIELSFEKFGITFGLKKLGSHLKENQQAYQQERRSQPLDSVMLKKLLEQAIHQLLSLGLIKQGKPIKTDRKAIIFIDDLDRCMPETAFRILEAIKVYLDLNNCIFVLGMDLRGVEDMIARHYGQQAGGLQELTAQQQQAQKNRARLYLEKICQDIYLLPVLSEINKRSYFEKLLEHRLGLDSPNVTALLDLISAARLLPPFARSIKIFANVLITHCGEPGIRAQVENSPKAQAALLILCYLYAFHYELHQLCYLYAEADFYNQVLLAYCEDPVQFRSDEGEHPLLEQLILPEDPASVQEATAGERIAERAKDLLARSYPHEHLRQVFWVRKLITETGILSPSILQALQL